LRAPWVIVTVTTEWLGTAWPKRTHGSPPGGAGGGGGGGGAGLGFGQAGHPSPGEKLAL